jgi:hypothetical protein
MWNITSQKNGMSALGCREFSAWAAMGRSAEHGCANRGRYLADAEGNQYSGKAKRDAASDPGGTVRLL